MSFELKLDLEGFRRMARRFPGEVAKEVTRSFDRIGQAYREQMFKRMEAAKGGPPFFKTEGDTIATRSGALRGTAGYANIPAQRISDLRLQMFVGDRTTAAYTKAQEFGATIRPKAARFLTIPLPDNLTGSKGRRAAAAVRFPSAKALKEQQPGRTWIQKSKAGNLIVMYRPETPLFGKDVLSLFILKSSVTLKPRLGFRLVVDRMKRFRQAILGASIAGVMKRLSAGGKGG